MAQQPPPPPMAGPPADYFMTPTAADPSPPSPAPAWAQQGPGYVPAPVSAGAYGFGILSQFTGAAGVACLLGLLTIVIPFALNRVFYVTPIVGILTGVRAIQRGKLIGGAVGIGLNAVGALITVIALTAH